MREAWNYAISPLEAHGGGPRYGHSAKRDVDLQTYVSGHLSHFILGE